MLTKISDYIIDFIYSIGVDTIFCVTGGGAMHMNNSLGQSSDVNGVFMLHEQGAAIAAEAYARIHDGFGCCLVTSGPGATNALTGLVGAYIDSIPVIFISGQAKRADLIGEQQVRQFGIQEVDIISMVKSYTKYAVQIQNPNDIRYEMEKAAYFAAEGRPGPVWLDIPLDIQAERVEIDKLGSFSECYRPPMPSSDDMDEVVSLINASIRPVIILGHGIRLSHSVQRMRELYNNLGIPILVSWNGVDLIEDEHPLYFGRPGAVGQRAANLIQQTADLVISIGTRLNLLSTGYNYEGYMARAKHVMVDIDEHEMDKKNIHPYLKVVCDAGCFIEEMINRLSEIHTNTWNKWIDTCRSLTDKYPIRIEEQQPREGYVSTYEIIDEISSQMTTDDIYQFTSSGTSVDIGMKVFRIKWGQRAFLTKGLAAMGYDIPASVGSCIASGGRRTVCVTGDGSFAMNMQELEVIRRLNLPIKIFVTDNNGYGMIHSSQKGNFGRLTGCTEADGLTLPNINNIAGAFGIFNLRIDSTDEIEVKVKESLEYNGPVVCTFKADITQQIVPKQTNYMRDDGQMASRPLEDMSPLIDREELEAVLAIGR